jgi:hypothetical protein
MNRVALAIFSSISALIVGAAPQAFAQSEQPDLDLAYVLATASYCAYAVGEADLDGGQQRASQCLKAAADSDPSRLALIRAIAENGVEAFFNPNTPEDAYLLIKSQDSVILAFRGTLTPPIVPGSGGIPSAVEAALAKYREREAGLIDTFIGDWRNNFKILPENGLRHTGFADAWSGLAQHLMGKDCAAGAGGAGRACSKFLSFVGGLPGAAPPKLYVTGHSKGGALATLAGLDLPGLIGAAVAPVVYTFAGAKAVTAEGAKNGAATGVWRFEHQWDIVPSVPLDKTAIIFPSYVHVGGRVFFAKGRAPDISGGPVDGFDPPGDLVRLPEAVTHVVKAPLRGLDSFDLGRILDAVRGSAEVDCQALVENHFLVFSDVQEAVWARHGTPPLPMTTTEAKLSQSFFFTGLPDDRGEILWGFSQWCRLLRPDGGRGQAPN